MVAGEDRKWKEQKVTVEVADAATLGKLAANKGRNGMRLINLWSTSCGPCVIEFPELVKIYRQYSWQEFEFIPISLDPAGEIQKVTRFLKNHECGLSHRTKPLLDAEKRTTNNYIFDGDTEDLAKAIDPEWDGALPYTLLIGKNGEILYRHSGVVEPMKLKRKIVEQVWEKSKK
jgi:thiol-disulfide isomerase/thioredoxin